MPTDLKLYAFIRTLLDGETAICRNGKYLLADGRSVSVKDISRIADLGGVDVTTTGCRANVRTKRWLDQARSRDCADQHRLMTRNRDGAQVNRNESPLDRLNATDPDFLAPHQIAAGERLRQLYGRAQMQMRMTASYTDRSVRNSAPRDGLADISDVALDARQDLSRLHTKMPRESLAVAIAVCGELRGLQEIERQLDLPRRCARFMLRLALEQLALIWGMAPLPAVQGSRGSWMAEGARPPLSA